MKGPLILPFLFFKSIFIDLLNLRLDDVRAA